MIDEEGEYAMALPFIARAAISMLGGIAGYAASKYILNASYNSGALALPSNRIYVSSNTKSKSKTKTKADTKTKVKAVTKKRNTSSKPCWEAKFNGTQTDVVRGKAITIQQAILRVKSNHHVMCQTQANALRVAKAFPKYYGPEKDKKQKPKHTYYLHYHPNQNSHVHIWYLK